MSPNKSSNIIKYCVIASTTSLVLIFISMIPVTQKAIYWNKCLKKTYEWIDNETSKHGSNISRFTKP